MSATPTTLPAPLGDVWVEEVFVEYDEPLLYLVSNRQGLRHLVSVVEEDDAGQLRYLVQVSDERLQALRSGVVDLHDAFARAETGAVWVLHFDGTEERRVELWSVPCEELRDELLPAPGYTLLSQTTTAELVAVGHRFLDAYDATVSATTPEEHQAACQKANALLPGTRASVREMRKREGPG